MIVAYNLIGEQERQWMRIDAMDISYDTDSEILKFTLGDEAKVLQRVGFENLGVRTVLEGAVYFMEGGTAYALVIEPDDVLENSQWHEPAQVQQTVTENIAPAEQAASQSVTEQIQEVAESIQEQADEKGIKWWMWLLGGTVLGLVLNSGSRKDDKKKQQNNDGRSGS